MFENEKFHAQIFESAKSDYVVRYKNDFERTLIERLEKSPKVKKFFQPMTYLKARRGSIEYQLSLDFYIEYFNKCPDLIHIEAANSLPAQLKMELFDRIGNLLQLRGFGFQTFSIDELRQLIDPKLKQIIHLPIKNSCRASFEWIN